MMPCLDWSFGRNSHLTEKLAAIVVDLHKIVGIVWTYRWVGREYIVGWILGLGSRELEWDEIHGAK